MAEISICTKPEVEDSAHPPSFVHRARVQEALDHLFGVFRMEDVQQRRCLFAALLVENAIVLLTGTYGTGKTQLVHLIRKILFSDGQGGYHYSWEACHQDLTAFDVLYHLDLAELQKGREIVHPKAMVSARLKFFNEIQRSGTAFYNALLPLLAERCVTYRGVSFEVPPFLCIMDRNPHDAGASEIPEAFLDRVDFSFEIPAVHLEDLLVLQELRKSPSGYHWGDLETLAHEVISFNQLAEVWSDVKRVSIPKVPVMLTGMITDALRLCVRTDRSVATSDFDLDCVNCQFYGEVCSHLRRVPGMRVSQSVLRLAQALAWLDGRSEVQGEDILCAFPWTLSHRLSLCAEELRKHPSPLSWVREVALSEIILPKLKSGFAKGSPIWIRALEAFEAGEASNLEPLSGDDLVIAELHSLLQVREVN